MSLQKRYQIFISSTYQDLQEERQVVFRAIQKMGHIPAGMEQFPAFGAEQMEYIKRVIDRSDYYVVIVAGRYGSLTTDKMSFTEAEYEYALEKKLTVIPMIHKNPETIEVGKVQVEKAAQKRLDAFKKKLSTGRIRGAWETPHELAIEVMAALGEAFDSSPAVGWVRADEIASTEALTDIVRLQKENTALHSELSKVAFKIENLARFDEEFKVKGPRLNPQGHVLPGPSGRWELSISWGNIFLLIAEAADGHMVERLIYEILCSRLAPLIADPGSKPPSISMDADSFKAISIQLRALGLIAPELGDGKTRWTLTKKGELVYLHRHALRTRLEDSPIASDDE